VTTDHISRSGSSRAHAGRHSGLGNAVGIQFCGARVSTTSWCAAFAGR
jgi:hypothetical protein